MYIVILGGGKLGEYLATAMLKDGNQVCLIEQDEKTAEYLSETLPGSAMVICGDGCELSIQEDAALSQADVFVTATGQDENNLAACQIASRLFSVPRCIARVNSPKNQRIFRSLGIESISATALIARMIQEEATAGSMRVALTMTSDQVGLLEVKVPRMKNHDNEAGVNLGDLDAEEGIRVIAVNRKNDNVEVVNPDTLVYPGEQVILAADTDKMDYVRNYIRSL